MPAEKNEPARSLSLIPLRDRGELRADCANCYALCCTAFGFEKSADFAVDKPPGSPCRNLAPDFSCTIHAALRPRGFPGCITFDCFGAGQTVSSGFYPGRNWRTHPGSAQEMFRAFSSVRDLHEMLWYLAEAANRTFDPDTAAQAETLRTGIGTAIAGGPAALAELDLPVLQSTVRDLLIGVSEEVRAGYFADGGKPVGDLGPYADLAGRDLRTAVLCGADLRGACLIAADLRGTDLSGTDLLGADLRGARIKGSDLSRALYLTQPQVNSARGDQATLLPPDLSPPADWPGPAPSA